MRGAVSLFKIPTRFFPRTECFGIVAIIWKPILVPRSIMRLRRFQESFRISRFSNQNGSIPYNTILSEGSMNEMDTSPSLLMRIRDPQDGVSWSAFVDVYTPIVFRYLTTRGLQAADAADVAQDTLIEVLSSIRRLEYDPRIGRFRDWLATITKRKFRSCLRTTVSMQNGLMYFNSNCFRRRFSESVNKSKKALGGSSKKRGSRTSQRRR
jgi:hypothetical protein